MRDFDVAGTLNFKSDQSLRLAEFRIRIHQDGHDMSIDDVDERVPIRNNLHLIPLARLDHGLQVIGAGESSKQSWLLARLGGYNLAAPGDDAARRVLLVELSRVFIVGVEIRL